MKEAIRKYKISENNLISKAKELIPNFQLTEHTAHLYKLLTEYINNNPEFEKRNLKTNRGNIPFELRKGLFFISRPGTGKSFIFEDLLKPFAPYFPTIKYRELNAYQLQGLYQKHGLTDAMSAFNKGVYSQRKDNQNEYNLYVDDLGRETEKMKDYGTDIHFIDHFIDYRSRLFKKHGVRTYCSSNLDLASLSERYSGATVSRMFLLFNFVVIDSKNDFRINVI